LVERQFYAIDLNGRFTMINMKHHGGRGWVGATPSKHQ
jgi:hypothetical protein